MPRLSLDLRTFGGAKVARPFAWSITGDSVSKVAVLVTTLVAARTVGPDAFGEFIGASAALLLAAAIGDAGLSTLVTRECAAGRTSVPRAVHDALLLKVKLGGLWLIAFILGMFLLSRTYPVPLAAITLFAGASLTYGWHMVLAGGLKSALLMKPVGIGLGGGRVVTALLAVMFASTGRTSLTTLALAVFLGELSTLCVFGAAIRNHAWDGIGRPSRSLRLREALPFAGNSILNIAYNRFDVVLLAALAGSQQLSLYAPASRIQDALYLIPGSIGTIALPLIVSRVRFGWDRREVWYMTLRLIAIGLVVTLPLAVGLFIYMPNILTLLLGPSYTAAVGPTRILIWSMPLASVGAPLLALLSGGNRAIDSTKTFALAFVAAVILHFTLDWWAGAVGAAVASLVRDGVNVTAALHFALRKEDVRFVPAARPADASVS